MKYNNIKKMLRSHIEKGLKTLWTFDEEEKEFKCIYEQYNDELKIYTAQQLLEYLDKN